MPTNGPTTSTRPGADAQPDSGTGFARYAATCWSSTAWYSIENVIVGEGLGAVNFGKLLALNETAAWLWKEAQAMGDFTVESLADRLCEEYNVSPDEARQDVSDIIASWKSVDVIE